MKEQIKGFWVEHKETIKTYTILVLTPIAVAGIIANNNLTKGLNIVSNASDMAKLENNK